MKILNLYKEDYYDDSAWEEITMQLDLDSDIETVEVICFTIDVDNPVLSQLTTELFKMQTENNLARKKIEKCTCKNDENLSKPHTTEK